MITYTRASQDDSTHFRSSGSGARYSPRRRAQVAAVYQGAQEHDAGQQAREGQSQYTPIKASVHADFPELPNLVPSPTISARKPCTGQIPLALDQDSAKSKKESSSQMNQPEPFFQKQKEPILNDSSQSPKVFSLQDDDGAANSLQDELSISEPMPGPRNAKSKLSKLTWNQQEGGDLPINGPGSDEIIDGLPAEQYKPRPSRSRSGHGDFDLLIPVDFSKRPEISAKRKNNRRKTTAFERPVHDSEEDREIVQSRNPVVIIETRSNVESSSVAVGNSSLPTARKDQLQEVQDAELVTKSVTSKKRARPRKQLPGSTEELDAPNVETEDPLGQPEPKISGESSPSKPLRKKRKVSPERPTRNVSDSESCDEDIEPKTGSRSPNTILKGLTPPSSSPSTKCTSGTSELPSPRKALIPPQTPQKPIKGPDKHSPLANSKVAYRVGLSKRARIEPLLRIVRK